LSKRTIEFQLMVYAHINAPHAESVSIHESTMGRNAFPPSQHGSDEALSEQFFATKRGLSKLQARKSDGATGRIPNVH
jgi:hypothetical protein